VGRHIRLVSRVLLELPKTLSSANVYPFQGDNEG
jgi:hypothetical protein